MNSRLKILREHFGVTQAEFAKMLGVGQSTLAMMEVSKRPISERHIKSICAILNVNEEWLRTGQGEMLIQNADSLIDQLSAEYHLDGIDRAIIDGYLQLGTLQRKVIKDYLSSVSAAFTSTNVQAFKMPAYGNSAAQGILSADDQSAMGKIKDDLSTEDDSDKI